MAQSNALLDAVNVRDLVSALLTTYVAAQRDSLGAAKCRTQLVGPWRKAAEAEYPPNVTPITAMSRDARAKLAVRGEVADMLRGCCLACGRCKLGRT